MGVVHATGDRVYNFCGAGCNGQFRSLEMEKMKCDNSEAHQCDDCDMQEKCCLDCNKGSTCKNICYVQISKNYWNSKTTEELIKEIASDESTVLNLAVADRLELLQNELKECRASELRPATKFVNLPLGKHIEKIHEEFGEVLIAALDDDKEHLCEEIVDLQMTCETALAGLRIDAAARADVRRQVILKNKARGYYDE